MQQSCVALPAFRAGATGGCDMKRETLLRGIIAVGIALLLDGLCYVFGFVGTNAFWVSMTLGTALVTLYALYLKPSAIETGLIVLFGIGLWLTTEFFSLWPLLKISSVVLGVSATSAFITRLIPIKGAKTA